MTNWKTTLTGIGVWCTAAAAIIAQVTSGHIDVQSIIGIIGGAVAGTGLVAARDYDK